jgi:heme-degrading monooxygenase HmoA
MWAQLIQSRTRPDLAPEEVVARLRAAQQGLRDVEQPGSGLLRTLLLQDQADPRRVFTLVVFESEAAARAREQDPRRDEGLRPVRAAMTELFDGPPEFTDLRVLDDWAH